MKCNICHIETEHEPQAIGVCPDCSTAKRTIRNSETTTKKLKALIQQGWARQPRVITYKVASGYSKRQVQRALIAGIIISTILDLIIYFTFMS